MTLRDIIKIDEKKCNGCGLCAKACAEGAIRIIGGKAVLVSESYCDGLGACIGHCPQGALTIEKHSVPDFDEEAVHANLSHEAEVPFVCPGLASRSITKPKSQSVSGDTSSQLISWPIQLKLISPNALHLKNCDLLLVGDCVPFAMGNFHSALLKEHALLIGCPKLDDAQFYTDKLAQILKANSIRSLTVAHMEVPCCGGLSRIASQALSKAGLPMNFKDVTIDLQGDIISTENIEHAL